MRGADRRKVRIERHLRSRQTDAERKLWFAVRDRRLRDRSARQLVLQPQQTGAQLVRLGGRDEVQPGVRIGAGRGGDHTADQLTDLLNGPKHARCRQQPSQFGNKVA